VFFSGSAGEPGWSTRLVKLKGQRAREGWSTTAAEGAGRAGEFGAQSISMTAWAFAEAGHPLAGRVRIPLPPAPQAALETFQKTGVSPLDHSCR